MVNQAKSPINFYQCADKLYYAQDCIIRNNSRVNMKILSQSHYKEYVQSSYYRFQTFHVAGSKLYAVFNDVVYEVELNVLKEVNVIRKENGEVIGVGYNRSGVYKDQLIVTNETQFMLLQSDNSWLVKQFQFNNEPITSEDTTIASFNGHCIADVRIGGFRRVFELDEPECKLLFQSDIFRVLHTKFGVYVIETDVGDEFSVVKCVDMTKDQLSLIEKDMCFGIEDALENEYGYEPQKKILAQLVGDGFFHRREKIIQDDKAKFKTKFKNFSKLRSQNDYVEDREPTIQEMMKKYSVFGIKVADLQNQILIQIQTRKTLGVMTHMLQQSNEKYSAAISEINGYQ